MAENCSGLSEVPGSRDKHRWHFKQEWDYETIKKSLTVYVRNAQENIDFLASCPHEIREDLALVYGFHVLVDGEKAGSAIINYDRLRWLGVSEEQLKQDAWENMKQSNPPCFWIYRICWQKCILMNWEM